MMQSSDQKIEESEILHAQGQSDPKDCYCASDPESKKKLFWQDGAHGNRLKRFNPAWYAKQTWCPLVEPKDACQYNGEEVSEEVIGKAKWIYKCWKGLSEECRMETPQQDSHGNAPLVQ